MRLEPGEEVGVLAGGQVPRQHLIQVVVTIDHAGQQDVPFQIEHRIRGRGELRRRPDLLDDAVAGEQPGAFQLPALPIHGDDDVGIFREQRRHVSLHKFNLCYIIKCSIPRKVFFGKKLGG